MSDRSFSERIHCKGCDNERSYCEECGEVIADEATGFFAARVGIVSGRWLCLRCGAYERGTMKRARIEEVQS